jgi:L-rhamnose mutarotase
MQRIAQLIGIKADRIAEYEQLHAAVWPEVLATIRACNVRNYSIFRHGTELFAYFEYIGQDFDKDMARMAADPKTQQWCKPMQQPLTTNQPDEWWTSIGEVFHTD